MARPKKSITPFFCIIYLTTGTAYSQLDLSTNYFKIHMDKKGVARGT